MTILAQIMAATLSLAVLSGRSVFQSAGFLRPNQVIPARANWFEDEKAPPIKVLRYRVRDTGREYEISNLEIRNSSPRTIKEVEFTWVVISREGYNLTTRDGLSFIRKFPNSLKPTEIAKLPFVVARIGKILTAGGNNSTVGLVVSDAIFADGTHWKRPPYHPL
jgi:hypothetical protein